MTEKADAKTVMVHGRVTPMQAERLKQLADDRFGGNVSAALRQVLTDSEALRVAREDYYRLLVEKGFRIPREGPGELSTALELILSGLGTTMREPVE